MWVLVEMLMIYMQGERGVTEVTKTNRVLCMFAFVDSENTSFAKMTNCIFVS